MPRIKQKQMKVIKISTKYGFSIGSKLTSKYVLNTLKAKKAKGGKLV